jgi:hypothetical protein
VKNDTGVGLWVKKSLLSEAKRDVMAIGHQQLRYTSWGAEIGVSCTMSVTFLRHEALIYVYGRVVYICESWFHQWSTIYMSDRDKSIDFDHLWYMMLLESRCFTFQKVLFTLVYWCRGSFIWKYRYCILIGVCILSNLFSSTLLHLHRFSLFVNV